MTIIAADGQPVEPLTVDELRIAVAETYDVLVRPRGRTPTRVRAGRRADGYVGTLAGCGPACAPRCPRWIRAAADHGPTWAMAGGMGRSAAWKARAARRCAAWKAAAARAMPSAASAHAGHAMAGMDHGAVPMPGASAQRDRQPAGRHANDGADPRLDDPGIGLRGNGQRSRPTPTCAAPSPDPDGREPGPHRGAAPDRPHGEVRVVVRRHQVRPGRAAAHDLRRAPAHRAGERHDDEPSDPPAGCGATSRTPTAASTCASTPSTCRRARAAVTARARRRAGAVNTTCHLFFHMESGMFREVGWRNGCCRLQPRAGGLDGARCPRAAQHARHAPPAVPDLARAIAIAVRNDGSACRHGPRGDGSRDHGPRSDGPICPHAPADGVAPALLAATRILVPTDADRAAAFPAVRAPHAWHPPATYWLLDRLRAGRCRPWPRHGLGSGAWIGGDVQRLWLLQRGHARAGKARTRRPGSAVRTRRACVVGRCWPACATGGEGPSRTWPPSACGGMAPYKFESRRPPTWGRAGAAAGSKAEYDTLLSNRWILQMACRGRPAGPGRSNLQPRRRPVPRWKPACACATRSPASSPHASASSTSACSAHRRPASRRRRSGATPGWWPCGSGSESALSRRGRRRARSPARQGRCAPPATRRCRR